jgi:hypothetical protein
MDVTIRTEVGELNVKASPLEVARLVASTLGFDLDSQESPGGKAEVVATHRRSGVILKAKGTSHNAAAVSLIDMLAAG